MILMTSDDFERETRRRVAEAYRRWAPSYGEETALSALDELAIAELGPHEIGMAMLDAGCGTGRRLPDTCLALGCDVSMPMLRAANRADGQVTHFERDNRRHAEHQQFRQPTPHSPHAWLRRHHWFHANCPMLLANSSFNTHAAAR